MLVGRFDVVLDVDDRDRLIPERGERTPVVEAVCALDGPHSEPDALEVALAGKVGCEDDPAVLPQLGSQLVVEAAARLTISGELGLYRGRQLVVRHRPKAVGDGVTSVWWRWVHGARMNWRYW